MKPMIRSILTKLGNAAAAASAVITLAFASPPAPVAAEPAKLAKITQADNNDWTPEERQWFYHASEGSRIMPYQWFIALEQIENEKPFLDPDHLAKFRIIPDPNRENNPGLVPVGFAKDCPDPVDPQGINTEYVGFTCAACHTGQINYKGNTLQIDGAPGQLNIFPFLGHLAVAIAFTTMEHSKFDRFAQKVLGADYSEANKEKLFHEVRRYIDGELKEQHPLVYAEKIGALQLKVTDPGFGRMDALGAGSNNLFGLLSTKNLKSLDAPVDVLPLWNAYSYAWVQSIAAIRQPMARNMIETLSVFPYLDLSGPPGEAGYLSSARLENLWMMESLASRLKPPVWPTLFGSPDQAKAERGRVLYQELCARCHVPQWATTANFDPRWPAVGPPGLPDYPPDPLSEAAHPPQRSYQLPLFSVDEIGTDPRDPENFAQRRVDATKMGLSGDEHPAAVIIPVIQGVMQRYYTEHNIRPDKQIEWNGDRGNYWRVPIAYPARPLAGIWATAPFLHNGSVPNLYELLSPVEKRSKTFHRGNLEFDPVRVGFESGKFAGGFEFHTAKRGNSNAGHEFRDGKGKGVIGRGLTEEERWQIIEYLKVLEFDQQVPPDKIPPAGWTKNMECPQTQNAPASSASQTSGGGNQEPSAKTLQLTPHERLEPGEEELIAELIPLIEEIIEQKFLSGTTFRGTHAKGHAAVRARFTVEDNLPAELRVGLFAKPRTYDAWVRLANAYPAMPRKDILKDIRAVSIKLMDVDGEMLWQSEPGARTLDLLLMSEQPFVAPNLRAFYDLERALYKGGPTFVWFALTHPAMSWNHLTTMKRAANLLELTYWSQTAYAFGDRVVQYQLWPHQRATSTLPKKPAPDFLRERLKEDLSRKEAVFDFMVQFQTDPAKMPVENPMVPWSQRLSKPVRVATLTLPVQTFDSPAQRELGENLSFNPWRTLPEHRPLGAINRARLQVYQALSKFRHYENNVPVSREPTPENPRFPPER